MRTFDIYYSGVITIEAETEKEARNEFYRNYYVSGDIEEIKDVTEEYERLKTKLDAIKD